MTAQIFLNTRVALFTIIAWAFFSPSKCLIDITKNMETAPRASFLEKLESYQRNCVRRKNMLPPALLIISYVTVLFPLLVAVYTNPPTCIAVLLIIHAVLKYASTLPK